MSNPKPRRTKSGKPDAAPPAGKPILTHPTKPGDPKRSSDPDFGQSVEAGGVD